MVGTCEYPPTSPLGFRDMVLKSKAKGFILLCGTLFMQTYYRGADKSLARIDNSYVKIKQIICLSSL